MNELAQTEALKVIKDRIGNKFLASWSGPEDSPTGFTWSTHFEDAHSLTTKQAHVLRAGITALPTAEGGLAEPFVAIMDFNEAAAANVTQADARVDRVLLHHPLQGYYVKHTIQGSDWTITWSPNLVQGAILSRVTAETIMDNCGMPALEIIETKGLIQSAVGKTIDAVAEPLPLQPPRPAIPFPVPKAKQPPVPQQIPTKPRYDVITSSNVVDLARLVNEAMAKGAQLVGGLAINQSGDYLQAVVCREPIVTAPAEVKL